MGPDKDESDLTGFGAAVLPAVPGGALHHDIAGRHVNLRVTVQKHVALAGHADGVIDGVGAVHVGVFARREFEYPEYRAAGRGFDIDCTGRRVLVSVDVGRRIVGHPDQRLNIV